MQGFPGSLVVKEFTCNAGDHGLIPGSGRSAGGGIGYPLQYSWTCLVAHTVKNPPAMQETWVRSLGWEDSLEKEMTTHSSVLAQRIPWTVHGVAKSWTRLSRFHFSLSYTKDFSKDGNTVVISLPACNLQPNEGGQISIQQVNTGLQTRVLLTLQVTMRSLNSMQSSTSIFPTKSLAPQKSIMYSLYLSLSDFMF